MRFDVRGELGMTMRKKGMRIDGLTFQDYFGRPLPPDACLPELRREFEAARHQAPHIAPQAPKQSQVPTPSTECFAMDQDSEAGSIQSEVLEDWPDTQGTGAQPTLPETLGASPPPVLLAPAASSACGRACWPNAKQATGLQRPPGNLQPPRSSVGSGERVCVRHVCVVGQPPKSK